MPPQCFGRLLTMTFVKAAGGRKREWFHPPLEFHEQEGFTFTQEKELLYAAAVILRELIAEFPVKMLGLLKRSKSFIRNEEAIVALEEIREDKNLVPAGHEIARPEMLEPVDRDAGAGNQFGWCQLSLVAVCA